jgi:hypothetical protein
MVSPMIATSNISSSADPYSARLPLLPATESLRPAMATLVTIESGAR